MLFAPLSGCGRAIHATSVASSYPSRGQSQEFKVPKALTGRDNIQKIFMFLVRKRIYLGEEKRIIKWSLIPVYSDSICKLKTV